MAGRGLNIFGAVLAIAGGLACAVALGVAFSASRESVAPARASIPSPPRYIPAPPPGAVIDPHQVKWDPPSERPPRDLLDAISTKVAPAKQPMTAVTGGGVTRQATNGVPAGAVATAIGACLLSCVGLWILYALSRCPYCGCRRTKTFCAKCGHRLSAEKGKR